MASALSIPELLEDIEDAHMEEIEEPEPEVNVKALQEASSKGKVHGSLFMNYLLAGGNVCLVMMVLSLYIVAQACASGVDFFVSFWVNIEELRTRNDTMNINVPRYKSPEVWTKENCIRAYTFLIVSLFVTALARSMLFYKLAMWCSQKLHDTIFNNVVNATMRFFDTNPSGRILNRFSKDIGNIDEMLPKVILDAGQILLSMVGSLVLITIVKAYFLILVGVVGVFFFILRHIFLKSSKNIKRLEGICKSKPYCVAWKTSKSFVFSEESCFHTFEHHPSRTYDDTSVWGSIDA